MYELAVLLHEGADSLSQSLLCSRLYTVEVKVSEKIDIYAVNYNIENILNSSGHFGWANNIIATIPS